MRFHALMLLRDESDILQEALTHLLTWADAIYVYDLGSLDNSWEIVQDFASRDRRVVPWMKRNTIFGDQIRSDLFEAYRDRFRDGDWIVRADADEFYEIAPPDFVRQRLRPHESAIYLSWYYFRLSGVEVSEYEAGIRNLVEEREKSIFERRPYFKIPDYAEPRLFRYRSTMQWPAVGASFPFNAGLVARERIPIRHYPHRDPAQMELRFELRAAMMSLGSNAGPHWRSSDWRSDVLDTDPVTGRLIENNNGSGLRAATGHTHGDVFFWDGSSLLPTVEATTARHLARGARRLSQRVIHRVALPVLDRYRPGHSGSFERATIPDTIQLELKRRREVTLAKYNLVA